MEEKDLPQESHKLSRNHDGDFILIVDGKFKEVVAKSFTPLWYAIINYKAGDK